MCYNKKAVTTFSTNRWNMGYNGGAVYNYYVHAMMDMTVRQLEEVLQQKKRRSWIRCIWDVLRFEDWELKAKAVTDLITLAKDPNGPLKDTIGWKVASWRSKR